MQNDVSPQILLALLNDAWNRAADAANSFRQQLLADQSAAVSFVKTGSVDSVGKNSAHQTYSGYGAGKLTQTQIVEAITSLLACYDKLLARITNLFLSDATYNNAVPAGFDFDTPIASPDIDPTTGEAKGILTRILIALSAGVELRTDITDLNIPVSGRGAAFPCQPMEVSW